MSGVICELGQSMFLIESISREKKREKKRKKKERNKQNEYMPKEIKRKKKRGFILFFSFFFLAYNLFLGGSAGTSTQGGVLLLQLLQLVMDV